MKTKKLAKNTYPERSGPNDFQCFGPPATHDGDFDKVNPNAQEVKGGR